MLSRLRKKLRQAIPVTSDSVEREPAAPDSPAKDAPAEAAEGLQQQGSEGAAGAGTGFDELPLPEPILRATRELGFTHCTPVQERSLPFLLKGRDLAGRAQTGTGKTAAFLVGALTHLLKEPVAEAHAGEVRMLILAPTRELAIQIHRDAEALGKYCNLCYRVVFGGMDHQRQRRSLEQPIDILVATPGRLLDYCRGGYLQLNRAEILVIDEADRMLDMGFIPDVRRIVAKLPPPSRRQTMLFSATLERRILRLVSSWQHNPEIVEVEPEQRTAELVEEIFYAVCEHDKLAILYHLLQHDDVTRMLIFCNRKDRCGKLYDRLSRCGINCALMSGDVDQRKRLRLLEAFRAGELKVVIATDVAARGIHVDDISHVVNYDLPFESEMYVHRIGRTGRAGMPGKSISLVCEYGGYYVPELEEYLERTIDVVQAPEEMLQAPPMSQRHAGQSHLHPDGTEGDHAPHGGGEARRRGRRPPRRRPRRR